MTVERGFSLLELVVSLFAASLLMTLIMQQYLVSKRQYLQLRTQLARDLELQWVVDLLRDSLRRGGFTPCEGLSALQTIDSRNGKSSLVAVETKEHALQINRMDEHFARLLRQLSPTQLLVSTDVQFEKQQTILVADCYHAEVQELLQARKGRAGTVLTLKKALVFHYLASTYVGEWLEEVFFIQNNDQGFPALFYRQHHAEELSSLISSLSPHLNFSQERIQAEVSLGLAETQNFLIKVKVRGG